MKQLTERIYYMDADPETDQPFVYYIRGDLFHLQIDAGNSRRSYHRFLHELNEIQLPKPDMMVLTHWHWDHTFGMFASDCPVIASSLTRNKLKEVQTWKWDEESMKKRLETGEDIPFTFECMHKEYEDLSEIHVAVPDISFETVMTIDLEGVTCILEHRDSPHTRDAVMIYIPEEKVLIGGDAQYEDFYDNDSKYDPERLTSFLAYLKEKDFETYLKGHDEPAVSKADLIKELETAL